MVVPSGHELVRSDCFRLNSDQLSEYISPPLRHSEDYHMTRADSFKISNSTLEVFAAAESVFRDQSFRLPSSSLVNPIVEDNKRRETFKFFVKRSELLKNRSRENEKRKAAFKYVAKIRCCSVQSVAEENKRIRKLINNTKEVSSVDDVTKALLALGLAQVKNREKTYVIPHKIKSGCTNDDRLFAKPKMFRCKYCRLTYIKSKSYINHLRYHKRRDPSLFITHKT